MNTSTENIDELKRLIELDRQRQLMLSQAITYLFKAGATGTSLLWEQDPAAKMLELLEKIGAPESGAPVGENTQENGTDGNK